MSLKQAPSSRYPHPHRMPTRTHWREEADEEEPFEDMSAHLWVERTVPQAVRDVKPPRPEVTNAAWVDWVEQRMREARVAADKAEVPEVDAEPVVPELPELRAPWAPPVAAPAQVLAWQREREAVERAAVRRHRMVMTGLVSRRGGARRGAGGRHVVVGRPTRRRAARAGAVGRGCERRPGSARGTSWPMVSTP